MAYLCGSISSENMTAKKEIVSFKGNLNINFGRVGVYDTKALGETLGLFCIRSFCPNPELLYGVGHTSALNQDSMQPRAEQSVPVDTNAPTQVVGMLASPQRAYDEDNRLRVLTVGHIKKVHHYYECLGTNHNKPFLDDLKQLKLSLGVIGYLRGNAWLVILDNTCIEWNHGGDKDQSRQILNSVMRKSCLTSHDYLGLDWSTFSVTLADVN